MNVTMATRMTWIWCLLIGAAFSSQGGSTDALTAQADAIVVGEVQSGTGSSGLFLLSVARTIKGGLPPGASVSVQWSVRPDETFQLTGNYGLFFLANSPGGQWKLLPVRGGGGRPQFRSLYFPLSKANPPNGANPQAVTPNDSLAIELATAIEHYSDLLQLRALAEALFSIQGSSVTYQLHGRLSTNTDPEVQFLGLSGMVRTANDAAALAKLAQNIDAIPSLKMGYLTLATIRSLRDPSPENVRALAAFASSASATVQRSAAEALCDIHTLDTLPILANLLDSPDQAARESALRGLSLFVDNLPPRTPATMAPSFAWLRPQGPAQYKTAQTDRYSLSTSSLDISQEAAYLQFWKTWWAAMKSQLTPRGK